MDVKSRVFTHVIISMMTVSVNLSGSAETTHTSIFLMVSTSFTVEDGLGAPGAVVAPSALAATCLSTITVMLQSPTLTATDEGLTDGLPKDG